MYLPRTLQLINKDTLDTYACVLYKNAITLRLKHKIKHKTIITIYVVHVQV